MLKSADQLNALRVGADKGTTNEITLREKFPKATIVAYDDTPFAFAALRAGTVQAITQDGPKLIGLLANVPDKQNYEIPAFTISNDYMGVGVPKGETRLLGFVNDTLKGPRRTAAPCRFTTHGSGRRRRRRSRASSGSATRPDPRRTRAATGQSIGRAALSFFRSRASRPQHSMLGLAPKYLSYSGRASC